MPGPYTNIKAPATLRRGLIILLAFVLLISLTLVPVHAQTDSVERSASITLQTDSLFSVSSNRESLRLVEIEGNLSAARFSTPPRYPTDSFSFAADRQGVYSIRLEFNCSSEYKVTIAVTDSNGVRQEKASYYLSGGQLLLTAELTFETPDSATQAGAKSVWESVQDWTTRFGAAFPLWVKLLYVALAVQFVAVGKKWIGFENQARDEDSLRSRFDRGNLLYLWSEILWKFLLTAFLVIAIAMSGQFILIFLLRFMFLAQINMLSLWDLFVLGFAAGIAGIGYALKLGLEKLFDLKPLLRD
jgi:hypothetical protein